MFGNILLAVLFIAVPAACEFNETEDCGVLRFRCSDGSGCLPQSFYCDGKTHCADNSDEYSCKNETCKSSEFRCHDGACAPRHWRCDGVKDCKDGSDELLCTEAEMCTTNYWKCSDGSCISRTWRCDGVSDCEDESDETGCDIACQDDHFKCGSGVCIPYSWTCDNHPDCIDGSDELNCNATESSNAETEPELPMCASDKFLCDGNACIPLKWLCDGEVDCKDKTDEIHCSSEETEELPPNAQNTTTEFNGPDTNGSLTNLTRTSVPNVNTTICDSKTFFCDGGRCIDLSLVCDGFNECMDQTDELHCSRECRETEFACRFARTCIPEMWICDGEYDCPDRSDEIDCESEVATEIPMYVIERGSTLSSTTPKNTEMSLELTVIPPTTSKPENESTTIHDSPSSDTSTSDLPSMIFTNTTSSPVEIDLMAPNSAERPSENVTLSVTLNSNNSITTSDSNTIGHTNTTDEEPTEYEGTTVHSTNPDVIVHTTEHPAEPEDIIAARANPEVTDIMMLSNATDLTEPEDTTGHSNTEQPSQPDHTTVFTPIPEVSDIIEPLNITEQPIDLEDAAVNSEPSEPDHPSVFATTEISDIIEHRNTTEPEITTRTLNVTLMASPDPNFSMTTFTPVNITVRDNETELLTEAIAELHLGTEASGLPVTDTSPEVTDQPVLIGLTDPPITEAPEELVTDIS